MTKRSAQNPQVLRGIVMVMFAVAIFAVGDFLSKYLARFYPIGLIVWARYAFHLLFVVVVILPRHGLKLIRTARPGIQLLRCTLLVIASILFVWALKYLPLAESTSIAYLAPLMITVMSVVFLKEKIERARWIAVVCGFIGVLTIIRPGSTVFSWAVFLPMGNALAFATYQILTRRLYGIDSPYTSIFYSGLVGTALLSLALPFSWVTPQNGLHAAAFVGLGVFAGFGHLILTMAYAHGPASRLAPYSYSQLIWVMALGYLAFGDFPDRWSLLGIAILVGSGIYTATHQRIAGWLQRDTQRKLPPSV